MNQNTIDIVPNSCIAWLRARQSRVTVYRSLIDPRVIVILVPHGVQSTIDLSGFVLAAKLRSKPAHIAKYSRRFYTDQEVQDFISLVL